MIEHWKKLSEKEEKVGHRGLVHRVYCMPDGREADYTLVGSSGVVCVLPLTEDNKVILARQFRPGPEVIYDELPGGGMDEDTDPATACARELLEETGHEGELEHVASIPMSGYVTGFRHCFVARNCKKISEPQPDENEFIEVIEKTVEDFIEQARKGEMTDTDVAWLGIDYLKLL